MPTDLLTKKKFSFTSKATDDDSFAVVSFTGSEAISQPYEFEIVLVSEKTDIDPLQVLHNSARFTIHRDKEQDVHFNGIVMQFEETQEFNGYLFFKAVLAPKLRWLALTHHNQVFLDLTIPGIMREALKDAELSDGIDFEFRLQNDYQPIEYVCQYDESHLNFVSRWAEREGIYYFFEQTDQGEKVVFTDTKISQADLVLGKDLIYMPQTGLDSLHTKEVIKDFVCKHTLLPERVYLKDYNYRKPSLAMEGIADVDPDGRGENYIYGEQFFTPEEGNHLAKIRAEELLCRKSVFLGGSSVPFMVPGFTFDLQEHYRGIYNKKYLITDVSHEGHQTGYLISGLGPALTPREEQMFYSNSFTAIYSDVQFRPVRIAVKPKISGTINAKIDAASSGQYAELDEQGRYKVILPFDRSGRHGGKASAWFRMMQPYAGTNQGMHFPLHKGTEVLLTFIDGDPDRPLIAGAVPNPETASPVTVENQTKSVIATGKSSVDQSVGAASYELGSADSNYIEFDDDADAEHIYIHSADELWQEAGSSYGEYHPYGEYESTETGDIQTMLNKFGTDYNPTKMIARHLTEETDEDGNVTSSYEEQDNFYDDVFLNAHVHVSSLDTVTTQEGNIYDFGGYWNYNLGNSYTENHMDQDSSVTLNSSELPNDRIKDSDGNQIGGPNYDSIEGLESHGNNVWVEKHIKGAEYEYKTNHTHFEVHNQCNDIEHRYGGKDEKYLYDEDSDDASMHSIAESGRMEEWIYDRGDSSKILSYESTKWEGSTLRNKAEYSGTRSNHTMFKEAIETTNFVLGGAYNYDGYVAASFNMETHFGLDTYFTLSAAAKVNIGIYLSGEIDLYTNPAWKIVLDNGKPTLTGPGTKIAQKEELEAELQQIILRQETIKLKDTSIKLGYEKITVKNGEAEINNSTVKLFT
ncbi:MAG: type VI secretion system tip protein TssI/VgrG [Candidatus Electrothrix aestuarii]|uniref:Type VI secretion system tip protein TssI/VgrG n=1 Tax=Candidatus Electrothrix aestuarii TaxID=3062594 RepID=A0AAU8LU57_9BACT|nr:type VI secretion system tip protein TssI/VgrG [Candidatus Electrothrix aestuarii]